MTGRTLAAALVAIALLTFVLPPLAARQVQARRVARAQQDLQFIADALAGGRRTELEAALAAAAPGVTALTGPGITPKTPLGFAAWPPARMSPAPALFGGRIDPWGNHYNVLAPDGPAGRVVVLSAGPNGTLETVFQAAAAGAPAGDDIVVGR